MLRTLALMRHALATGQGPDAALLPEGVEHVRRLAARLEAEGWRPAAIVTSPYLRARQSAMVLASELGVVVETHVLSDLVPESEPEDALAAILERVPIATPVLVVSHLPLVSRLLQELTGDDDGFSPGTFVEVARDGQGDSRMLRRIEPRDLNGG